MLTTMLKELSSEERGPAAVTKLRRKGHDGEAKELEEIQEQLIRCSRGSDCKDLVKAFQTLQHKLARFADIAEFLGDLHGRVMDCQTELDQAKLAEEELARTVPANRLHITTQSLTSLFRVAVDLSSEHASPMFSFEVQLLLLWAHSISESLLTSCVPEGGEIYIL